MVPLPHIVMPLKLILLAVLSFPFVSVAVSAIFSVLFAKVTESVDPVLLRVKFFNPLLMTGSDMFAVLLPPIIKLEIELPVIVPVVNEMVPLSVKVWPFNTNVPDDKFKSPLTVTSPQRV